jgi:hypothetical protein
MMVDLRISAKTRPTKQTAGSLSSDSSSFSSSSASSYHHHWGSRGGMIHSINQAEKFCGMCKVISASRFCLSRWQLF